VGNVITPTIDPDIKLDERFTKNMPDSIKQPLLITMTMQAQRLKCHWRDLTWSVKYSGTQPIISVKRKDYGEKEKNL
jgi:hypothetical protein